MFVKEIIKAIIVNQTRYLMVLIVNAMMDSFLQIINV